jgi:hypothetical protein
MSGTRRESRGNKRCQVDSKRGKRGNSGIGGKKGTQFSRSIGISAYGTRDTSSSPVFSGILSSVMAPPLRMYEAW